MLDLSKLKSFLPYTAKREMLRAVLRLNLISAAGRALPDFLVIGAQKCGTTSLYNYLVKHPSVAPSLHKEVRYFDRHFDRSVNWYRAHFARAERLRRTGMITGEASPYYIFDPLVPARVFELLPRVRLIALLRNPIDRAYSHYQMQRRYGNEPRSFEEVVERETRRLKSQNGLLPHNGASAAAAYLERGIYAKQLKSWLAVFPAEQLLIIKTEEFDERTSIVFRRVLDFLELESWEPNEYGRFMTGSYQSMDPRLRAKLSAFYAEHNKSLYDLLDEDMEWDQSASFGSTEKIRALTG